MGLFYRVFVKYATRKPIAKPPKISIGKCTPAITRATPTRTIATRQKYPRRLCLKNTAKESPASVAACEDGKAKPVSLNRG